MNHRDLQESNLTLPGSIIVGALIIAWAIVWAAGQNPAVNQANTAQAAGQQQAAAPLKAVDMSKLKVASDPFIGSATAPIIIGYWYDYQCPFCKRNEDASMASLINEYVKTGKAKVVFKDFAFLGPDSVKLAVMARAVWAAAPDKFYEWHQGIFAVQGREGSGWATDALINDVTKKVLGDVAARRAFSLAAANGDSYKAAIEADRTEGGAFGVTGTPAFVIGKAGSQGKSLVGALPYTSIKAAIDAAK